MGLCWQEHGNELPLPPLGALSDPGIEPCLLQLLHWQADSLPLRHLGSPVNLWKRNILQGCFVDAQLSCAAVGDWYNPLSEVLLEDPAQGSCAQSSARPSCHLVYIARWWKSECWRNLWLEKEINCKNNRCWIAPGLSFPHLQKGW